MSQLFVNLMRSPAGFLLLGALSLLVVLVVLYLGGWRYLTGPILGLVDIGLALAMVYTGILAVGEFIDGFFGQPTDRSMHLTWGLIMTASSIFLGIYLGLLNDDANPVGRFLKQLKPPMSR